MAGNVIQLYRQLAADRAYCFHIETSRALSPAETDCLRLILADGSEFAQKGRLEAAEPQVEPTTGMITLRMTFPNPDHILLPGMYVEVDLPQAIARNAVALPQNAVMRDRVGNAYVWVVDEGKVAQRPIQVASSSGNQWIVTDGVKAGDQVITSGFQKTAVGAPVEIVPAEGTN